MCNTLANEHLFLNDCLANADIPEPREEDDKQYGSLSEMLYPDAW
jgi:hypothetical protein